MNLKVMDFSNNAEESSSSLEFLVLLLKKTLQMRLFTNPNAYLANAIDEDINDNFDPIILFCSPSLEHAQTLIFAC